MLLFLLPLIFSPFGLAVSWLPTLYLALWPLIIQTLGRDTLVTHSLVLILFILTCDIVRQTMLRYVSIQVRTLFDLFIALETLAKTNEHFTGRLASISYPSLQV